jgi:hypothetical protein
MEIQELTKEPKLLVGAGLLVLALIFAAYSCSSHQAYVHNESQTIAISRSAEGRTEVTTAGGAARARADSAKLWRNVLILLTLVSGVAGGVILTSYIKEKMPTPPVP